MTPKGIQGPGPKKITGAEKVQIQVLQEAIAKVLNVKKSDLPKGIQAGIDLLFSLPVTAPTVSKALNDKKITPEKVAKAKAKARDILSEFSFGIRGTEKGPLA